MATRKLIDIVDAKTYEKALRAIELHALIVRAEEELEALKKDLRASAEAVPWRELPTEKGSVRAALVGPTIGPVKVGTGSKQRLASLQPLWEELSRPHFKLLAHRETIVVLDASDPVAFAVAKKKLTTAEREVVSALLEEKKGGTRLTFPVGK